MPINEDKLCVLKVNTSSNQISLTSEPVETQLRADLNELYEFIKTDTNSGSEIFDFIKNHPTLNILFRNFNFCTHLSAPYQGLYGDPDDIKESFEKEENRKKNILEFCKIRALAYSLEIAYQNCETNNNVLAFSHRRVGWSAKPYKLDENFSIEFKTNFGYGNASYFYTKLKYKEIDIVPISEWVKYRYANMYEIICASAVHSVDNESWTYAMKYGQDACNLFATNKDEFVNKYLKQECEKLLKGLHEIKTENKFTLRQNSDRFNPKFNEVEFTGTDLIIFRGEKISGALFFIESIKNLNGILSIENYITQIEKLNIELKPILKAKIKQISDLLPELEGELTSDEIVYNKLREKEDEYDDSKSKLEIELTDNNEFEEKSYYGKQKILDSKFLEIYPEYTEFSEKLETARDKYFELSSKIHSFKSELTKIEQSVEKIDDYFENKK